MKALSKCVSLVSLLVICIFNSARSQDIQSPLFSPVPSKASAAEFLKRPIVLCKREVDPKEAEKLAKKDPAQLKAMEDYNSYYNETMKLYFDRYFKGSKNIELKSRADVYKLLDESSPSVAVVLSRPMEREFSVQDRPKTQDTYSF